MKFKKIDATTLDGYEVRQNGTIISHKKNTPKVLKLPLKENGYLDVCLNGGWFKVHRVVATVYLQNPKRLPCVNHKNGIKTDNRVENLEWCTHSENSIHAFKQGLNNAKNRAKGEHHVGSKISEKDAIYIRKSINNKTKTADDLASRFNIHKMSVYKIANGSRWKHLGVSA
jgi:hypothetical protein